MKIEMCSDRALTKPAVIVHGRTGWCLSLDCGCDWKNINPLLSPSKTRIVITTRHTRMN